MLLGMWTIVLLLLELVYSSVQRYREREGDNKRKDENNDDEQHVIDVIECRGVLVEI
jgi:uncharacterized membrane protein